MRTSVDLPDDLYRQAKAKAAMAGMSLREFIEAGVRHMLGVPDAASVEAQHRAWVNRLDALFAAVDAHDAETKGSAGPFTRDELYADRLTRFR